MSSPDNSSSSAPAASLLSAAFQTSATLPDELVWTDSPGDSPVTPPPKHGPHVLATSIAHARELGVPVITAMRNPKIEFVLKKSTAPFSDLTDEARNQINKDYQWCCGQVQAAKNDPARAKEDRSMRALKYDRASLARHYMISISTLVRTIKLTELGESAMSKRYSARRIRRILRTQDGSSPLIRFVG